MPTINYDIVLNEPGELLFIRDRSDLGGMTITNGAEAVVAELYRAGLLTGTDGLDRDLVYEDSEGQVDRLLHDHGRFLDFSPALIAQRAYIKGRRI